MPEPAAQPRSSSLAWRAFQALALTIGFYALALGIVVILVVLFFAQFATGHFILMISVLCIVGVYSIVRALLPGEPAKDPPWALMTAEEHPRLFEKIQTIAAMAGQPVPETVYVLPDVNAWVSTRGTFLGLGGRRIMGIGLPLFRLLSVSELCAVIAHEFGHYRGGDTRLGVWIYNTRAAIGRTLMHLENTGTRSGQMLREPFMAYGRMFLRVTHDVSRQQEYAADAFAASVAGNRAVATSLQRLIGYEPALAISWDRLYSVALEDGYRLPFFAGVDAIVANEYLAKRVDQYLQARMADEKEPTLLDTHPPLRDRIAALVEQEPALAPDASVATSLLDNWDQLEEDFLTLFMSPGDVVGLKRIGWDEVGEKVFVPGWRQLRDRNAAVLSGWTIEQVPALWDTLRANEGNVVDAAGNPQKGEMHVELSRSLVTSCLYLCMLDAGWFPRVTAVDGVTMYRPDQSMPDCCPGELFFGEKAEESWREHCDSVGITGIPMSGREAPAAISATETGPP
ncbi:MAG TPA: M48 family metallopeptidase [Candidatus Krumholzibacteria bacterium]|nr:M48 family metallopeptidase [Candidatus Krumholzibacteria bacterium]